MDDSNINGKMSDLLFDDRKHNQFAPFASLGSCGILMLQGTHKSAWTRTSQELPQHFQKLTC